MYTIKNYKTKKELKADFANGKRIETWQPNSDLFGGGKTDGRCVIEGPQYPEPHRWYCSVEIKDSIITKIIS